MATLTEGKCQICGAGWWSVNTIGVDATVTGFICSSHPKEEKDAAQAKAGKEHREEWENTHYGKKD